MPIYSPLYFKERERRSPPFNLQIHPFSDGVSALQIYCMKEGVKVGRYLMFYVCKKVEKLGIGKGEVAHDFCLSVTGCHFDTNWVRMKVVMSIGKSIEHKINV